MLDGVTLEQKKSEMGLVITPIQFQHFHFSQFSPTMTSDAQNAKRVGLYTFCKTCRALEASTRLRI